MIAIIAAMAANRVIGRAGKIPWHLPEDKKRFRELTMGNVIVMGRRTWEEIGRPLPGRVTALVSATCQIQAEEMFTVPDLEEAIRRSRDIYPDKDIFLCGGEAIYKEGMSLADRIYLTVLDREAEGDTYFPEIGKEYQLMEKEKKAGFACCYYERRAGEKEAGRTIEPAPKKA